MLKYLIIHLDDTSVSICHYPNNNKESKLLPLDILKEAIIWSMKENLTLQIIYPDYNIPQEYKYVIENSYHSKIFSANCTDVLLAGENDVVIFDSLEELQSFDINKTQIYVIRTTIDNLIEKQNILYTALCKINRLNIVFTDILSSLSEHEERYKEFLELLGGQVVKEFSTNHIIQINILTDRVLMDRMNNCNAGYESITLAPDGKFYICPAFYLDGSPSVGNLESGLDIKNPQLYRLDHSPICKICDAYHCRRCVWLNNKSTHEVNTPSHEQCVISHLERNSSKRFLDTIKKIGDFFPEKKIEGIDYLDPFYKIIKIKNE